MLQLFASTTFRPLLLPFFQGKLCLVPSPRKLTVCVLATHSIVLSELKRTISDGSFKVLTVALVPSARFKVEGPLPRANVYVVDGESSDSSYLQEVINALLAKYASAKVLLVGKRVQSESGFPLLRAGAKGLLRSDEFQERIHEAIRLVDSGGYWVPRGLLSKFLDSVLKKGRPMTTANRELSRRERDVVQCILDNLSNKEIADRLCISERTVKFHVSNVLTKFGVRRRSDLILHCYQELHHLAATPAVHRVQ